MGSGSSWLRGIVRAGGAALVVPFGLLLAVAVAASVGGGSFGGLGQLVAGPEVPAAGAGGVTSTSGRPSDAGVPRLPAGGARGGRRRAGGGPSSSSAGGAAPRSGTRSDAGPRRGTPTPADPAPTRPKVEVPAASQPRPPTTTPTQDPPPPPPTTTSPSPTTPAPSQNPVRRVGAAVQEVVRPLPVVGPPAADAVGTVVDLVAPPTLP